MNPKIIIGKTMKAYLSWFKLIPYSLHFCKHSFSLDRQIFMSFYNMKSCKKIFIINWSKYSSNVLLINYISMSRARKTTRTWIKSRTQQGKQIIRNASLNLIQDSKHKDARQEHGICWKMIQTTFYSDNVWKKCYDKKMYPKLMLNGLKVMRGPTPIYTPLGT
jgi:hypothetical protein